MMVKLRQQKIDGIAQHIPAQTVDNGNGKGKILIIGWGSTYGAIKSAVIQARAAGIDVSHAHVRHLNPFPENLGELLYSFEKVLIPEINNGQLIRLLRDKYLIPAISLTKIQGKPFSTVEILNKIKELDS